MKEFRSYVLGGYAAFDGEQLCGYRYYSKRNQSSYEKYPSREGVGSADK